MSNKKEYVKPVVEKIEFDFTEQVVAMSGSNYDKPGHGWGDKNHDHTHWKDR